MRKVLLFANTALSLLLCSRLATAQTTPNLITNGNLEARNHAPHGPGPSGGQGNIGPVDSNHQYADLLNWHYPPSPSSSSQSPTYRASDGDIGVGTTTFAQEFGYYNYGFTAHGGISCVSMMRHDAPGDKRYDDFITQTLSQPLLGGHTYHAEFWALRLPGGPWHTKLALSVTAGNPTYNASQNTLSPSPGNKVVTSSDIQQRYVWTLVSGDITIPGPETTNQWVSVGYDRSDQVYDPNAISDPFGGINFAIDDISLVDMGCTSTPLSGDFYIARYEGCRKIYGFTLAAIPNGTQYVANVTVGGVNRGSTNGAIDPAAGNDRVIFPLELEGYNQQATATITVTTSGSCPQPQPFTTSLVLQGPDPGCVSPGDGTMDIVSTPYPNPANESIMIPANAENITLFNNQGREVKVVNQSGKLDVQNLPDGLYNLRMRQKGKFTSKQIKVKH